MSEPLSKAFATAFITTCFEEGLSKEAAAALLQKESVDQAKRNSPSWAEGYTRVMGDRDPALFTFAALEHEKSAALRALIQGGKSLAGKGLRATGRGIKYPFAQAGKGYAAGMRKSPVIGGLTSVGLGGAGILGINHLMKPKPNPYADLGIDDPMFGSGKYDPDAYGSHYKNLLGRYEPGIFAHNKARDASAERLYELEKAVESGTAGGAAYRELADLRRANADLTGKYEDHMSNLGRSKEEHQSLLDRIVARTEQLEANPPKKQPPAWQFWRKRQPTQEQYDAEIARLYNHRARTKMNMDLVGDRIRMLNSGQTGKSTASPPTSGQLQSTFFPTFN